MASEREKAQVIAVVGKLLEIRSGAETEEVRKAAEAAIDLILPLIGR